MATFFLETYAAAAGRCDLARLAGAARAASAIAADHGLAVSHVRTVLAPADEICFHVFEAESAAAVARMAKLAGLAHERITEVVEERAGEPV